MSGLELDVKEVCWRAYQDICDMKLQGIKPRLSATKPSPFSHEDCTPKIAFKKQEQY